MDSMSVREVGDWLCKNGFSEEIVDSFASKFILQNSKINIKFINYSPIVPVQARL